MVILTFTCVTAYACVSSTLMSDFLFSAARLLFFITFPRYNKQLYYESKFDLTIK